VARLKTDAPSGGAESGGEADPAPAPEADAGTTAEVTGETA
jgi:hypothetical protein